MDTNEVRKYIHTLYVELNVLAAMNVINQETLELLHKHIGNLEEEIFK